MTDGLEKSKLPHSYTSASMAAAEAAAAKEGGEALAVKGLASVKHVVLVLSGKGGVGKSTVAVQLARAFQHAGQRVGMLDVDLCGPSVPVILGLRGKSMLTTSSGWLPVFANTPKPGEAGTPSFPVVSIGFLTSDQDAPVIWRGPKKNSVVRSLVHDVCWGNLDVLVVDTPPGTSDEHLSVIEHMLHGPDGSGSGGRTPDGAVLVTTPQHVAVLDVQKELTFCRKMGIPVLGVFENMSGYVCPHCSERTNIFSSEGGRLLAEHTGVPFLGAIPIDPSLCEAEEQGTDPFTLPSGPTTLAPLTAFVSSFLASSAASKTE